MPEKIIQLEQEHEELLNDLVSNELHGLIERWVGHVGSKFLSHLLIFAGKDVSFYYNADQTKNAIFYLNIKKLRKKAKYIDTTEE